jgi:hypothetical protein
MPENLDNFKRWYSRVLESLYKDEHAGFVILMTVFPLLERYLREKSGVHEGNLTSMFYKELCQIFPVLTDESTACNFWQVYRNGLLHQVALSQQKKGGGQMPKGWLSSEVKMIRIESPGVFWVNPANFARKVVETIESDFSTFEACSSVNHPLPEVRFQTVCGANRLGTSGPGHKD